MNMLKPKTSRDPARNLRPAPLAPVVRRRAQTLAQSLKVVVRQMRPGSSVAAPQIAKRLGAMAPIALRQLAHPSLGDRRDLRRLANCAALRKKPDHLKMRPLHDGVGRAKPSLEFVSRKMNNHPCHDPLRIMTTDHTRSNNPRESLSESFKRIPYECTDFPLLSLARAVGFLKQEETIFLCFIFKRGISVHPMQSVQQSRGIYSLVGFC